MINKILIFAAGVAIGSAVTWKLIKDKVVTYETTDKWDMTVEAAYEYLKTLPEFKGAEDI